VFRIFAISIWFAFKTTLSPVVEPIIKQTPSGRKNSLMGPGDSAGRAWRSLWRSEVRFVCYILVASIVVDRGRKECTGSCGVITLSRAFMSPTAKAKTAKLSALFLPII